jgi:hypothetical protein
LLNLRAQVSLSQLVRGLLDGLLLDTTGWTRDDIETGAVLPAGDAGRAHVGPDGNRRKLAGAPIPTRLEVE